jgi:hypothetical protein
MDAARLTEIGEFLFEGDQSWTKGVAAYLGVHEATVFRWLSKNTVPKAAAMALELSFQHGLLKETELARG